MFKKLCLAGFVMMLIGGCRCGCQAAVQNSSREQAGAVEPMQHSQTDVYDGWRLGVQAYSFRKFTFFEAVDKTRALGLGWIQAYPGQKIAPDCNDTMNWMMSEQTKQAVLKKLADSNVRLVAFGVIGAPTDEVEYRKFFEFAKTMGIEMIVSEPAEDQFDMLDKLCQEYQIKLAIHNHPQPSRYWNPDTVLKVVEGRSKWIGACVDVGHWVRSGLDPVECLKKLQGRICDVHIKEIDKEPGREISKEQFRDVVWGTAQARIKGVLEELHRQGYQGTFAIEYENNWDNNLPEIRQSIAYFNSVASTLKPSGRKEASANNLPNAGAVEPVRHPQTDVYDGWRLGVQAWTFNQFTFFEAVDKTRALGLGWIQAYPGQKIAPDSDATMDWTMSKQTQQAVLKKLADSNVRLVAFGVVDVPTDEAQARKFFEFAKTMGIEVIVSEPPEDQFDLLDKLCQEYQIKLAIHNHPQPSSYWNPDTVLKVVEGRSKWIGACVDVGHWVRSGLDPLECLKKLQGRICDVHIKEVDKELSDDVVWGTAQARTKDILMELHRQGYQGTFAIEYEHNWDDSLLDIRRSIAYFNSVASTLKPSGRKE